MTAKKTATKKTAAPTQPMPQVPQMPDAVQMTPDQASMVLQDLDRIQQQASDLIAGIGVIRKVIEPSVQAFNQQAQQAQQAQQQSAE